MGHEVGTTPLWIQDEDPATTAPWQRVGTDVILDNIGDNVGIGVAIPGAKLAVVNGVAAQPSVIVDAAAAQVADIFQVRTSAAAPLLIVDDTGQVVIGGAAPVGAELLRVVGDARIEGKLTVTGVIDPTQLLLTGAAKKLGATDAGSLFLAPFSNSVDAVQIREADDTAVVFQVDTLNGRVGIENAVGVGPQYRLDIGNLSYFAINSNFGHTLQHNSAAAQFWSIATRNNGDLDIAVTTTDPRPTSGTIGSADNAISVKANKDVDCLGSVTALNLKTHALIEDRAPTDTTSAPAFVTLRSSSAIVFSGRPVLILLNTTMFVPPVAAATMVELAIQIDAGADEVIAQFVFNEAGVNDTVTGALIITPTAGSRTIRLRWRRVSGTGTLTMDGNNQILLHAVEL